MTTALISNLMCSQPVKSKPELKSQEQRTETKLGVQGEITPEREEKAGPSLQEGASLIKGFSKNVLK